MNWFERAAERCAKAAGSRWAFGLAISSVLAWIASGPYFHYSDTWQLVANTFTTLVTFLMGFLILNTQTRESRALHIKLDELVRVEAEARNELIGLEQKPQAVIEQLAQKVEGGQ